MSDETQIKTTLYLKASDYRELKSAARRQGTTAARLVREAVAEYAAKQRAGRSPASLGFGNSGRSDLSENADELLSGMAGLDDGE